MSQSSFLHHAPMKPLGQGLFSLPTPASITTAWNMGSILGVCLTIQIVSGLILASSYSSDMNSAFDCVIMLGQDNWYGWLLRSVHFNGVSMFFACLFYHIGRGVYFNSWVNPAVWISGSFIFVLLMGTAFLGYVLPWGQMSFWGATVITNLLSAIPVWGDSLVVWVWGGYSVGAPTLSRFFMLHFILPFVLMALVLMHLAGLHLTGSTDPVGINSNLDKIPFHPYFSWKDGVGFWLAFIMLFMAVLEFPWVLGEVDNFIEANPLVTPVHIKPEWYFLFAYAVLRSVPNKLGGVIALLMSVLTIPMMMFKKVYKKSAGLDSMDKVLFWVWASLWILLTWCGGCPVEDPYVITSQIGGLMFFLIWIMIVLL